MADTPVYSGLGTELSGGTFSVDAPAARPAHTPDVTPAAREAHSTVTTGDVQRVAEYTDGDLQGGAVVVGFGPELPQEQNVSDSWMVTFDDQGARRRAFRIAESIGLMPLLRFANSAKSGADTDDMEGMAALYTMIRDCVHPDDWEDFQDYATTTKAEDEDLLDFVSSAIEVISARKAQRRGSSSATSRRTSGSSKGGSSRQASPIPAGPNRPAETDGLIPVGDLVR